MKRDAWQSLGPALLAGLALWVLQPLAPLIMGHELPTAPLSYTPTWTGAPWALACAAFAVALAIALRLASTPARRWLGALWAFGAWALTAIIATMVPAGGSIEQLVNLPAALFAFMLVALHGPLAFALAAIALHLTGRRSTPDAAEPRAQARTSPDV